MKKLFTALFIFVAATINAQSPAQANTVKFCFIKFALPAGCAASSESQVKCDDYSLSWIYLSFPMLESVPGQTIDNMSHQLKKFKKEAVICYLLDTQVKGYILSSKLETGNMYQLMAYGVANEQPVIVQLVLSKYPKSNDDIPPFARQIIRLSK